jgi:hypothetical protein
MDIYTRMEQPKKRRLIRKKPVEDQNVDDYCYGPYSREEDKYSPSEITSARIQQRMEKEKFYSTFCPPVIYDFINDKAITKAPTPQVTIMKCIAEPQLPVKSSFSIISADKLREVQRDSTRNSRETQRHYSEDTRDYRSNSRDSTRDYRTDKRDYRDSTREYRETVRDNDYHRNRDRDREYKRTTRHNDPPNPYNGNSYKPSKSKMELDNELGKYSRKF